MKTAWRWIDSEGYPATLVVRPFGEATLLLVWRLLPDSPNEDAGTTEQNETSVR